MCVGLCVCIRVWLSMYVCMYYMFMYCVCVHACVRACARMCTCYSYRTAQNFNRGNFDTDFDEENFNKPRGTLCNYISYNSL